MLRAAALAVLLSFGAAQATEKEAHTADSTLIPFAMQDQFKQEYSDVTFRDTALLVLVANKGGSKYSRKWSPALRDSLVAWSLESRVNLLGVATMKGVPFFLKGMVKGKLPKDPKEWMLLDWKGDFAKAYECAGDTCHVLIFDRQSLLRHQLAVGVVTPEDMTKIRGLLEEVSGGTVPSAPAEPSSAESPR